MIENIEYLIHRHNYVVVPGWGAFIANSVPARYDAENSLFMPPMRSVTFNPNVTVNGAELVQSISRRERISMERAARIIDDETAQLRRRLSDEGSVSFGMIGDFVWQAEGTPIFRPSELLERYASCGFQPISVESLRKQVETEVEQTEKPAGRSPLVRIVKVAASLVAAITVGAMLLIPTISDRNDNLAGVTTPSFTQKPSQTAVFAGAPSADALVLSIALPKQEVETQEVAQEAVAEEVATIEKVAEPAAEAPRMQKADRYCLVVASLPSEALAQKFINEQGGGNLAVYQADGKYRVYAATGATADELSKSSASLSQIFDRYPDAWACRMK